MNHFETMLKKIIQPRCPAGTVLEIGPGSLWPGLQLIRHNNCLDLKGAGYSTEQRERALEKSKLWKCRTRVDYLSQTVEKDLPLPDRSVDVVVSFGALHTWQQPALVCNEIARVLKQGGEFFIGDVRQDSKWWSDALISNRNPGLKAIYKEKKHALTLSEFRALVANTRLEHGVVQMHGPDVWVLSA
jgi:ubiquinone/menaquinone biosynthesis C-methylase UbiE